MICSYCGKENKDDASRCFSCGVVLCAAAVKAEMAVKYPPESRALVKRGAFWFFGGLIVTMISYGAAAPGGTYFFAWGAILFGAIDMLRGALGGRKFHMAPTLDQVVMDHSDETEAMLNEAARLESLDRDQAIAAYQEIIAKYPKSRASDEAKRNIEALTRAWESAQ